MMPNEMNLLDLALADPRLAVAKCDDFLAAEFQEPSQRVNGLRARGLAQRLLGDLDQSASDLEKGLELAEQLGDRQLRAGVALTLAGTRVYQGQIGDAKAILTGCIASATGEVRAEALFQLGTTHGQAGESAECLACYAEALPLLRQHERRDWESNLLGNRGIIHFWAGNFAASIRDLDHAIEIQRELGITAQAAINTLNKAQALYMMGDLAGSLDLYQQAEQTQGELGMPVLMHAQKIETYLAAGKFEDCLTLSQQTHEFHRESEMTIGKIRALLPGAEAALALGKNKLAARLAAEIPRIDGSTNFKPWIDRADLTRLEAKLLDQLVDENAKQSALDIHRATLKTHTSTALRAVLIASHIALVQGERAEATELLKQAAQLARKSPLHLQIHRWQLVATVRSEALDRRGALAAVRSGLGEFDRLVAGVSSYDTRVRASRHAEKITDIGIKELLASRRFSDAVRLIERLRSASIRRPALSSAVVQDLIAAETRIRTHQVGASAAQLLKLQRSVSTSPARTAARIRPSGDESLLTWVTVGGVLYCLHGRTRCTKVHRCGATADIEALAEEHRFVHRQLSRRQHLSAAATSSLLRRQAVSDRALDAALLPQRIRTRVVLNPAAPLMGIVWGSLPSLLTRPHVVAPSLGLTRRMRADRSSDAAILGSTALAHVPPELDAIAKIYGVTPRLDPQQEMLTRIDGAAVVHLAGHFESNGANPLLSGIPLGDTRLTGIDYLQLEKPPNLAVLSACASAKTEEVGGTAMGFVTAALAAGTRTVVATQTLIEDGAETVHTMARLHSLLKNDAHPADALLTLRQEARGESMTAKSLIVCGAGW